MQPTSKCCNEANSSLKNLCWIFSVRSFRNTDATSVRVRILSFRHCNGPRYSCDRPPRMSVSCVSTWLIRSQYNCSRSITNWRSRLARKRILVTRELVAYKYMAARTYPNYQCSRYAFVRTRSHPFRTNHPSLHPHRSSRVRYRDWNPNAAIPPPTCTHLGRSRRRS